MTKTEAKEKAKTVLIDALSVAYYKLEEENLTEEEIEAINFYINKLGNTMAKSIGMKYYTVQKGECNMTRKQYVKKMRQLNRDIDQQARKAGMKPKGKSDRIPVPHWGWIIPVGSHKGEKLVSYAQAWDLTSEIFKIK